MNRQEARIILHEMTKTEILLRHARSVELVMEAYGKEFGEDPEEWAVTGMLHDADYEQYPDKHPKVIVNLLRERKELKIAHAISAHYTKWNVPYRNLLDKALLACDELTGFIIACCRVRPDGVANLKAGSVIKKLKQKSFAAKVERDEVYQGARLLEIPLADHIGFIITILEENRKELGI